MQTTIYIPVYDYVARLIATYDDQFDRLVDIYTIRKDFLYMQVCCRFIINANKFDGAYISVNGVRTEFVKERLNDIINDLMQLIFLHHCNRLSMYKERIGCITSMIKSYTRTHVTKTKPCTRKTIMAIVRNINDKYARRFNIPHGDVFGRLSEIVKNIRFDTPFYNLHIQNIAILFINQYFILCRLPYPGDIIKQWTDNFCRIMRRYPLFAECTNVEIIRHYRLRTIYELSMTLGDMMRIIGADKSIIEFSAEIEKVFPRFTEIKMPFEFVVCKARYAYMYCVKDCIIAILHIYYGIIPRSKPIILYSNEINDIKKINYTRYLSVMDQIL